MRANPVSSLFFEDCRVPKENLLGRPGDGLKIGLTALDTGRLGIAAQALGTASAAFDAAVKYSKERQQFGKPISAFQMIQSYLAEMATEIDAARLLLYRACAFKDAGLPFIKHCDGNIWPIVDMMIDSGITALDPIDPQGGMDLGEVKAKFGHRVAIKGNVDCAETMTNGTVEDMVVATKAALKTGMPGGGYICSSSNSIHSAVKPENYKAMMDTIKEFGTYPCSL